MFYICFSNSLVTDGENMKVKLLIETSFNTKQLPKFGQFLPQFSSNLTRAFNLFLSKMSPLDGSNLLELARRKLIIF